MSSEDVASFTGITGASAQQAAFYIESSGGHLETALSTFFESGGATLNSGAAPAADEEEDEDEEMMAVPVPAPAAVAAVPRIPGGGNTLSGAAPSAMPAGWGSGSSSNSSSRGTTPANPMRSNQGPRVSTLRDLSSAAPAPPSRGAGRAPDDDSDDEDREQLEFFTGGEKSGLSVENPNARRNAAGGMNDMIKGILQKAKDGGASLASAAAAAGPSQTRSLFSGAANTLGSDDTPSVAIPDPTARSAVPGAFPSMAVEEEEDNEEPVIRNLIFWEDGFSIEDGELMAYDTPGNKEILAAINSGRAPLSLLKVRHDQPVELRIAKRLSEKWSRQPSAPAGPFAGSGNRLGSEAAPGLNEVTPVPPPTTSRAPTTMSTSNVFEVDGTLPITTLQIRLRDGERLIARFNHTHTIGDIRRYINASQPGQGASFYALQTTFPSKDLTDDAQTIKNAGILGSVVVQRSL